MKIIAKKNIVSLSIWVCLVMFFQAPVFSEKIDPVKHNRMPIYHPPYDETILFDRNNAIRGFNISQYHKYGRRDGISKGQVRGYRISQYHQYGRRRGVTSGQTRSFNINQYHKYGRRKGSLYAQTRGFSISQYHNYGRRRSVSHDLRRGFTISQYHKFGRRKGESSGQNRGEQTITIPKYITPICPDHVGWSSKESPTLFWYISDAWPGKIAFAINEFDTLKPDPVLEISFENIQHEGVYSVNLADYDIKLKPDMEYEFFFAIILDEVERTSDILTSGAIKYVALNAEQSNTCKQMHADEAHFFYAESGYWYDAYACIYNTIQRKDSGNLLKAHHESLLKQIHLPKVVAVDTF
jgi:hypothetical protein